MKDSAKELITRLIKEDKMTLDEAMLLVGDREDDSPNVLDLDYGFYGLNGFDKMPETVSIPFMHVINTTPHPLVDLSTVPYYVHQPKTTC